MKIISDIDNLDDRREIRRSLSFIKPELRWQFLRWVAKLTKSDKFPGCDITFSTRDREATKLANVGDTNADEYISNTVYYLTFMMVTQHNLDVAKLLERLTHLARGNIRNSG